MIYDIVLSLKIIVFLFSMYLCILSNWKQNHNKKNNKTSTFSRTNYYNI